MNFDPLINSFNDKFSIDFIISLIDAILNIKLLTIFFIKKLKNYRYLYLISPCYFKSILHIYIINLINYVNFNILLLRKLKNILYAYFIIYSILYYLYYSFVNILLILIIRSYQL